MKILQISDLHIMADENDTLLGVNTQYYFQQVLKQAHLAHGRFDLILVSGDLAQQPGAASYQRIAQTLLRYDTETLCLPGNHDDFGLMQVQLNTGLVSCRQAMQKQGWQIICLNSQIVDSPAGELADEQLDFLQHSLAAHPQLPCLIAVHHPCIASGSIWLDTMQIRNSAVLLDVLAQHHQVKAVTFGHIHQELARQIDGIWYFAAPATCFEFKPLSVAFAVTDTPPGYRVFQLKSDGTLTSACFRLTEPLQGLDCRMHGY